MSEISHDEWITYLNNYCIGELEGAHLIEKLPGFAPGKEEKEWVKKWAKEENYHHRLWGQLIKKQNIPLREMAPSLKNVYRITGMFVDRQDWAGSMIGAAVIEHMSNTAAEFLYPHADAYTRRIFKIIVGDDLGHLDFDLAQIKKIARTERGRRKIKRVHRTFLREFLQWPFRGDITRGEMDILNNTYQLHRMKLLRCGVTLPNIIFSRSLGFRMKKAMLELF